MKISPIIAPNNSVSSGAEGGVPSPMIRSMKLQVNQTPEWRMPEAQVQEMPPAQRTQNDSQTEGVEERKPLSPQFAALAKQKRALQKERALFEQQRAQAQQGSGPSAVEIARLKSEPLRVLLEHGVTYDQLAQELTALNQNQDVYSLKNQVSKLEESFDQKWKEREQMQEQQVLAEMQREARAMAAQGDDFELIRTTRSVPKVMELIETVYRERGEVLDLTEAMQRVESYLMRDAKRIAAAKKLQGVPGRAPVPMQNYGGMRTLTNEHTASVPMSAKARALAAFYGTLKK